MEWKNVEGFASVRSFFEFVIKNCVEMYVHVWNVLTYIIYTGNMEIYSSMEIEMQLHIFGVRFF